MDTRPRESWGLTETEREDLIWFFDGAKGGFGVRSNFGPMQDELVRRSISDEERRRLKADEARLREAIRRRRKRKPTVPGALEAMFASIGLPPPLATDPGEEAEPPPPWSREYARPKRAPVYPVEPTINEDEVERASHTRARLQVVGSGWSSVLYAAYGPASAEWRRDARGSTDHPSTLIGKAGSVGRAEYVDGASLTEIAIAVLESQREEGDQHGRALLWSKVASAAAAELVAREARLLYDEATQAYWRSRCEWVQRVDRRCGRCWAE